jgi:hypothetical protein
MHVHTLLAAVTCPSNACVPFRPLASLKSLCKLKEKKKTPSIPQEPFPKIGLSQPIHKSRRKVKQNNYVVRVAMLNNPVPGVSKSTSPLSQKVLISSTSAEWGPENSNE